MPSFPAPRLSLLPLSFLASALAFTATLYARPRRDALRERLLNDV